MYDQQTYGNADQLDEFICQLSDSVAEDPGVTFEEKQLVGNRYRMARDVKLLALAAELFDNPGLIPETVGGAEQYTLPSGAVITVSSDALTLYPGLLRPETWHSRTQIKDRVYKVSIGDKSFVLKELKTDRHTDTRSDGHRPGLSSRQEFELSQKLDAISPVVRDDIELNTEKAVGYVEFPNDYQFCLFEFDPMIEKSTRDRHVDVQALARKIFDQPERYRNEFERIRLRANELYNSDNSKLSTEPKREDVIDAEPDTLTYLDFCQLKADHIKFSAGDLARTVLLELGYVQEDGAEVSAQVGSGTHMLIEAITFDFEYHAYNPELASKTLADKQERMTKEKMRILKPRISLSDKRERLALATAMALYEQDGWKLPE